MGIFHHEEEERKSREVRGVGVKWGLEKEWMPFLPSEAEGWEQMVITQSCLPVCSEF